MGNFIYIILLLIVIFLLFKFNVLLGAIVALLGIAYGIFVYIPTFYASKGNQCFNSGDFEGAVKQYEKCMQHRPKVNHRINYAYMLMRTGKFEDAENVLNYILRFRSVKPELKNEARRNRCMVYYKEGRLDEAIEDAQTMFNEGYRTSQMYAMLGYFKILKDPSSEDTYSFCKEAYEYDEDNRDIKDNMLLAHYSRGEYEEARAIAEKAIAENPLSVEAYYHGAQVEAKLGNLEKANEYLDKLPECRWSNMTTVTQAEVDELKKGLYQN
jgi:tetratricopeptide (TPR) repeat protein